MVQNTVSKKNVHLGIEVLLWDTLYNFKKLEIKGMFAENFLFS